jgi:hypothetical protein
MISGKSEHYRTETKIPIGQTYCLSERFPLRECIHENSRPTRAKIE